MRRNAFSSVTSSPKYTTVDALCSARRMSTASPLSVEITANSSTAFPSVSWAFHACDASRASARAAAASSGRALRTCRATLAGLSSTVTPGLAAAIVWSPWAIVVSSDSSIRWAKPESNSAP